MARPKVNTESLKMRISPVQLEKLRQMAEKQGVSMADILRQLIDAA
ncbi:TPA: ribbon-helix-helix protein, CopG family [Klebsiella variicola]|nr:ribbon-helix-helix protein, CopG family [Klebsiella variicola]HBX9991815.1 ribbon-helix-helix protein, CopG family [Klebsiella variicola]